MLDAHLGYMYARGRTHRSVYDGRRVSSRRRLGALALWALGSRG